MTLQILNDASSIDSMTTWELNHFLPTDLRIVLHGSKREVPSILHKQTGKIDRKSYSAFKKKEVRLG